MNYRNHRSSTILLNATPEDAFVFLDDPTQLSSHMGKSSWMMAGSKMKLKLDEKNGRGVGAEIVLEGQMMGMPLLVRESVTESIFLKRKVWATRGPQKMIVIDQYKMGFELAPLNGHTSLRVFIDYNLPSDGLNRILGILVGHIYAKWCTTKMAKDAGKHFLQTELSNGDLAINAR
jgi:hypothetical protein